MKTETAKRSRKVNKTKGQVITPLETIDVERICSICQLPYTGWGNNAWPVNDGRCCSNCNAAVVIVARLNQLHQHAKKAKQSA